MAAGVVYWALWRVVPRWFGYEFVPRKEKLDDGTVVTVVRRHLLRCLGWQFVLTLMGGSARLPCAVLDEKARLELDAKL